jgi:phosphohistidine phosphatase SixA
MTLLARSCAAALLALAALPSFAADFWAEVSRPGAVVLIRHANAPGVGDPDGFRLDDCPTQRNLDDAGRAQARRLGEEFKRRAVQVASVLTSQWCRTRDTARLAFGEARDEPAFNSFFRKSPAQRDEQTAKARALVTAWKGPGTLVVVTHQVNITALTGVGAASSEAVVVRPGKDGKLEVLGTYTP